jgi:hypothetical protein
MDLVGAPYRLHYRSDRTPGRTSAYTLDIPLTGATVPSTLTEVRFSVFVAGRLLASGTRGPQANQRMTVTWDGNDAYGRELQGRQPITVALRYFHDLFYCLDNATVRLFGSYPTQCTPSNVRTRLHQSVARVWRGFIGAWKPREQGIGGWDFDIHHVYDPNGNIIYLGNGRQRSATFMGRSVTTVLERDDLGTAGGVNGPQGVAFGSDGSVYVADSGHDKVVRVHPDGTVTTVAGTGDRGYSGDGGAAEQAQLNFPTDVTLGPDGSVYIADRGNHRIRRVTGGLITTIVGTGIPTFGGDGGQAIDAHLKSPSSLVLGSDGSLYIADLGNNRVRRVGPDGVITTLAGSDLIHTAADSSSFFA